MTDQRLFIQLVDDEELDEDNLPKKPTPKEDADGNPINEDDDLDEEEDDKDGKDDDDEDDEDEEEVVV